ncbi:MAG TPA: hypothetical protein ENL43_00505 [candidate division WOR-3 bacterium]|uniref:Uncharacterized protein n=1 Tax=candidate division WOR-3 bacterium TaxID=2052148 RepID=A0A7V5HMC1_UNCW3|nr:hypothetical protein [candidate division WOR-3 bacterium]
MSEIRKSQIYVIKKESDCLNSFRKLQRNVVESFKKFFLHFYKEAENVIPGRNQDFFIIEL